MSLSKRIFYHIRHLKIAVYGKRLTSDTSLAMKTKLLAVKCFTYMIYSKDRERRTETLCLPTETWGLIFKYFSPHVA